MKSPITNGSITPTTRATAQTPITPALASTNAVQPTAASRDSTSDAPLSGTAGFAAQMQLKIREELLQTTSDSDPVAELRTLVEMLKEDAEALGQKS